MGGRANLLYRKNISRILTFHDWLHYSINTGSNTNDLRPLELHVCRNKCVCVGCVLYVCEWLLQWCPLVRVVRTVEGLQHTTPKSSRGQVDSAPEGHSSSRQTETRHRPRVVTHRGRPSVRHRISSPKAQEAGGDVGYAAPQPSHTAIPSLQVKLMVQPP